MNREHSQSDKIVRGTGWGAERFPPLVYVWESDTERGIFPRETCELLVVRGTTSFCNNKLQIFASWRKCCAECSNVMK